MITDANGPADHKNDLWIKDVDGSKLGCWTPSVPSFSYLSDLSNHFKAGQPMGQPILIRPKWPVAQQMAIAASGNEANICPCALWKKLARQPSSSEDLWILITIITIITIIIILLLHFIVIIIIIIIIILTMIIFFGQHHLPPPSPSNPSISQHRIPSRLSELFSPRCRGEGSRGCSCLVCPGRIKKVSAAAVPTKPGDDLGMVYMACGLPN